MNIITGALVFGPCSNSAFQSHPSLFNLMSRALHLGIRFKPENLVNVFHFCCSNLDLEAFVGGLAERRKHDESIYWEETRESARFLMGTSQLQTFTLLNVRICVCLCNCISFLGLYVGLYIHHVTTAT